MPKSQKTRDEEEDAKPTRSRRSRSRSKSKAEATASDDAVDTREVEQEIKGMETIDLDADEAPALDALDVPEGTSPMETVADTPVEEPEDGAPVTASDEETRDAAGDADDDLVQTEAETGDNGDNDGRDAAARDDSIESVADEDDIDDIRPPRKPRPRRYKIQEVIKVRQILLIQVVKEERGNKGAALTTYLSLAGRYCVLMPNTARGGGISRKITNAVDRKKLKEIASEIDVPRGAGLIVRTAGAQRTKAEIKRDYEYLQRLWEQIRELTLKSIAPAKIYEEGDLIKRSIRDLYNREIDEVFVEGDRGYRIAKDFMKMIMPSHAKNVKQYTDALPLFARYQVESYLAGMFNPTVQLKSGGYIVIGVTEALVAIDVNSGRATKEGSIEETALKTNIEAAEEVARQLRLRDLAGLIVIDFIDMDERKNNSAVEKRLKDKLKTDRARIQVGRISGFGLLEMSRQRLRPGMIEATTQPCPSCHGTGLIRSDDSMALSILRQIEEEGVRRRTREVLVRCPVSIANFLMNQKREHIAQIEARYGLSVRVEGDVHLVSPEFAMEKFKTATRHVPAATAPVVSVDTSLMEAIDADEVEEEAVEVATTEDTSDTEGKPKRRRRRRRRRGKSAGSETDNEVDADTEATETQEAQSDTDNSADAEPAEVAEAQAETKPARSRSRTRTRKKKDEPAEAVSQDDEPGGEAAAEAATADKQDEVKPKKTRSRAKAKPKVDFVDVTEKMASKPDDADTVNSTPEPETPAPELAQVAMEPETVTERPEPVPAAANAVEEKPKPKRRGWWSLGGK